MFYYDRSYMTEMMVRMKADEAGAVRDQVEAVWKRYAAQVPFQAEFADDTRAQRQYDADEARATTFAAFAGLAIIVACLGLYGLAAFTAERRTREIGIRKVLGAHRPRHRPPAGLAILAAGADRQHHRLAGGLVADARLAGRLRRAHRPRPQWFIGAGVLAAGIAAATIIGHALRWHGRARQWRCAMNR